jgi:hypothetical protein
MIKIIKFSALFLICFFSVETANAQIKEIGALLTGAQSDADKLIPAYLKPYASAFGADLSSGWYNTAKPHKLLGFDLTLSVSSALVPSSDKSFNVNSLNLNGKLTNGSPAIAPTIAGSSASSSNNPQLKYTQTINGNPYTIAEFNTPAGTGVGIVPAPVLQLGIGLVKGTEVDFRYMPNLSFQNDLSVQLWGIGIKHSIKQWIPGISMAPFFHLSVFAGYTKFTTDLKINYQPSELASEIGGGVDTVNITPSRYSNQQLQLLVNNFTGNIIASFDLPVVTFYGGVGLCYTTTTLKVNGTYPGANYNIAGKAVEVNDIYSITNPINASMTSVGGSATRPRLNLGIKFTMAVITFHIDYTKANYNVFTAGLGISFR